MTLLRLCVRWLYWRIRAARQERAPRPSGALARAWVALWCHPVTTLRLDALWGCVKTCGRALVGGVPFVPGVGPLAGEGFIAGGKVLAPSGLGGTSFEARHQPEALRDLLSRLDGQMQARTGAFTQATLGAQLNDPLRSSSLAPMLANLHRR